MALRDSSSLLIEPVKDSFTVALSGSPLGLNRVYSIDIVSKLMGSANRDPAAHSHPDQFRLDRDQNSHYTFGHGIHFCIGAPLGRLEARMAMEALLDNFAAVRHADVENERTHSHMLRGFHHLWLEFDAA